MDNPGGIVMMKMKSASLFAANERDLQVPYLKRFEHLAFQPSIATCRVVGPVVSFASQV